MLGMERSLTYKHITLIIGILVALVIVAGMFVSSSAPETSYITPIPSSDILKSIGTGTSKITQLVQIIF
jgi:hypothetical protein